MFWQLQSMAGSEGHYAKWSKPDRKANAVWHHLYVETR